MEYSFVFDVTGRLINEDRLTLEIAQSGISAGLKYMTTDTENNTKLLTVVFYTDPTANELVILEGLIEDHNGLPISLPEVQPRYDQFRNLFVTESPRQGSKVNLITVDFANKQTWYIDSTRYSDVVMIDSGDGLTFNLPNPTTVINLKNGKVSDEDYIANTSESPLTIEVKVGGVVKIETCLDTFGEYTVDYETGSITFDEVQSEPVTISYNVPESSAFYLRPDPGKILFIEDAETQFAVDTSFRDTCIFEVYGVKGQDPRLDTIPVPDGTHVCMGYKYYKTQLDFINESNGCYRIDASTNEVKSNRDLICSGEVYRWNYKASIQLRHSYGNYIKIKLKNDIPYLGSYAVATLYGRSETEEVN